MTSVDVHASDSFIEIEADGCGETPGREKGVDTAIVPHGNPRPILDPAKQGLACVTLFVEEFAVAASCLAVLVRRDARGAARLFKAAWLRRRTSREASNSDHRSCNQ